MVIDTSALLAMHFGEPERAEFVELIAAADDPIMPATVLAEASIVVESRQGTEGVKGLDEVIADAGIRIVAVDDMQASLALEAFQTYGKGRSSARLNFGDCFSYALAISKGRPLLYKGEDFAQTDVERAA